MCKLMIKENVGKHNITMAQCYYKLIDNKMLNIILKIFRSKNMFFLVKK